MMPSPHHSTLPVAVIGAGPVGLAAAAHLVTRGVPVRLYEAAETVGANVRNWGHVRLFSPWRYNTDASARAILQSHGWQEPPADVLPLGHDLFSAYLQPLAEADELASVIESGLRVRAISRQGIDKVVSRGRGDHPFVLAVEDRQGGHRSDVARAVIDASGTWTNPNPLGASGIAAAGERDATHRIVYGIPDVLGRERDRYAGRRVLVVGGGHSAANALLDLARLADAVPGTRLTWAIRGHSLARVFGGGQRDQLAARGRLGSDLQRLVERKRLDLVTDFKAERVETNGAATVFGKDRAAGLGPFDEIIVATGQRPDLQLTRELRLDLDPWLECPRTLGPMIDPNLHSCGTVPPHGVKELAHPEPGYFTVGVKSYGRAPTFLMATGYEQVRSVVAHLAGDEAAAHEVRLVLPETGVCSSNLAAETGAQDGCGGGDAPADTDACCAADAKAAGTSGCGCATQSVSNSVAVADDACCGAGSSVR